MNKMTGNRITYYQLNIAESQVYFPTSVFPLNRSTSTVGREEEIGNIMTISQRYEGSNTNLKSQKHFSMLIYSILMLLHFGNF